MFPKNLFNSPDDLVKAVTEIMTGKSKKEALDPVDAKALKGSHADRKDKDIDNDGDVDSSDEYLHNRRKAVMKAMKEATKVKENDDNDDDDIEDDEDEMTGAQKNDMDGDGKNDKKKKKKKDDELSDKPDKIDTKPSMDDARTMMAKEEVDLDEADVSVYKNTARKNKNDVTYAFGRTKKLDGQPKEKGGYWVWKLSKNYDGQVRGGIRTSWVYVGKDLSYSDAVKLMNKKLGRKEFKEEVALDEGKSGTGYDLYHKDFSSAMKHAYDFAKRKYGITISNDEIDDKVATGPRKPSEGKTNSYRLKGDKGAIQVQVYNKGGSKPFELNMYKEEVELDEGKMGDQWKKGAKSVKSGPFVLMRGKSGVHAIMQNGKKLGDFSYDDEADNFVANMKGMKGQWVGNDIDSLINHLQKVHKEEVDLDEMSDVQMKKREEIVKGMKKNSGDLKKRYGDRWKDVMYATATKQAMKEEMVDEARGRPKKEDDVSTDSNFVMQMRKAISLNGNKVNFLDGTSSQVSSRDAQQFMIVYNKQKSSIDKGRLMKSAHKSLKHFKMALQGKIEKPKKSIRLRLRRK